MNTFYHQHRIFTHLQLLTFINPQARFEIETRHFDLLARQQLLHLTVEIGQIKRIKRLKVIIAGFIFRRIFPIQEIIVERDTDRMNQIRYQLYFQTFTESRFPRRRRTGDQHNTNPVLVTPGYLFRNLCHLLFLHRFGYHDQFRCMTVFDGTVQIAHIIQVQCPLQSQMLFISFKHLVLFNGRFQLQRIPSFRDLEQHAVKIRNDIEQLDITGGRRQTAVKEIHIAIQLVVRSVRHTRRFDQACLIVHAPFTEKNGCIHSPDRFMLKRQVGIDNFTHALLYLVDRLRIYLLSVMDHTVVTF